MTATNHALTGAVIATLTKQPLLAVPAAFASHFVLDALPHFGFAEAVWKRNQRRLFHIVLFIDMSLLTIIFLLAAFSLAEPVLVISMLAAISPDFVWSYRFYQEVRHSRTFPKSRFSQFHSNIQRFERPWGLLVEVAWFAGACLVLANFL